MNQNIIYNNLNADDPKIIQDDRIKIKLKEHQKTAIHAMLAFEETGKITFTKNAYVNNYQIYDEESFNRYYYYYHQNNEDYKKKYKNMQFEIETNYGILADKVGSGKTFMTMGLISYRQIPSERDRIISSSVYSVMKYKDTQKPIKTNLILVPHNLILQWKCAFNNCTLKTYAISKKEHIDYLQSEENIFDTESAGCNLASGDAAGPDAIFNETACVEYYDTIIVSATMFDTFYDKFIDIKWARIIIDEIVSIKLPSNLEFKCNFIWFLTATPSGLRIVRRNYIRTLVSSMKDYTINNIIIKNDDLYVDESMNLPNLNQILIKCLTPKELQIIKEYVDDDIINMLNAGNIHDAIKKLNCNIETSENILEVITKKFKKELHNKHNELEYQKKNIPDDKKAHDERIKKIEDKIKELESKCKGMEERIKSFKEENCPICFNEFNSPMMTPCCNNLFCIQCLTLCKSCPMCRTVLDITKCILIDDKKEKEIIETKKEHVLCSKVDNLITLIKKKPNGKFLVFSNYDRTFDNLNQQFLDNNISFNKLLGSNVVINSIIKKFESGQVKVLMLNAINYGSGLNLQMATDIVIYHELDVELETQVIGRAQRLGRIDPLNVYYLFHENEKINCKNPTLNLDLFDDDISMLETFIKNDTKIEDENIIDEIAKTAKTKTKSKTKTKKDNNIAEPAKTKTKTNTKKKVIEKKVEFIDEELDTEEYIKQIDINCQNN